MAGPIKVETGSYTRHVILSGSRGKLRGLWVDADIDTETLSAASDVTVGASDYVAEGKGVLKLNGSSSRLGAEYPGVGLNVSHSAYVGENLYVKKDLKVEKNTTLEGPVTISGEITFPESVTFSNIKVSEKANINNADIGKLQAGEINVARDLKVYGNLDVLGTLTKINTEDLVIKDNMVEIASGSKDGNGAGLFISGAGADPENGRYGMYVTWSALRERLEIGNNTYVDGKLEVRDRIEVPELAATNITASTVSADSFSGHFLGSFEGDGSKLEHVKAKIEENTVIRETLNIAPGSSTKVINSFNTPNVMVSVYEYLNSVETEGIQVYPKVVVHNDQDQSVEIFNPSDTETFRGYVVVTNSGHVVGKQVDWVQATTMKAHFSGSAGDRIQFDHNLGTENVIVALYQYVDLDPLVENGPKGFCQFVSERVWIQDENRVEITLPFDVEDGYVVITKAGHVLNVLDNANIVEVARVTGRFVSSDGTKELTVRHNFNDTEVLVDVYRYNGTGPKYLYTDKCRVEVVDQDTVKVYCPEATQENPITVDVVVGKAGHVVDASMLQLDEDDLDRLGVHYDARNEPNLGRSFYADERMSAEEIVGRNYVDTLRVGTKETQPVGGYGDDGWGSYIEFTDGTIDSYIAPVKDVKPEIVSKLDNVGNLSIGGELFTKGVKTSSDIKFKKDISILDHPLENIEKISGVRFTWKDTEKKDLGVIAQDVQKVYPELVDSVGFGGKEHLSVNYNGLVAVLLESVKELSGRVRDLEEKLEIQCK